MYLRLGAGLGLGVGHVEMNHGRCALKGTQQGFLALSPCSMRRVR